MLLCPFQQHGESAGFQQFEERYPVHSRRFHRDCVHLAGLEPIGEEYTDQGQDYYEERYRERVLRQLAQRAEKMGMRLVPGEIVTS